MEKIKDIVDNIRQMLTSGRIPFQNFVMDIQKLMDATRNSDKDTLDGILYDLKEFIIGLTPIGAALLSTACGAMVESGGDPMIAVKELLQKVEQIASLSMDFNNACYKAGVPEADDPQAVIALVKRKMPEEAEAWDALERIYPPVVAMLSKSKEARRLVKTYPELVRLIFTLARNNKGAIWLAKMFAVLDDEEMLVFYPSLELGYRIITSGIADNYQLHLLLAGALIGDEKDGWIPGTPPDPTLVSYVRDVHYIGDARTEGFFEMRNWRGLKPDGTLVQTFETYNNVRFDYFCIWGEGPPAEIPPFDMIRVIFLDPPSSGKVKITRSFNTRRVFPFMDAELEVIEKLSKETVRDYFKQIIERNEENKDKPFISKEAQERDMSQMLFGRDDIKVVQKEEAQPKKATTKKMTTLTCSNCGSTNKIGDKFCGYCGKKLSSSSASCKNCNAPINEGETYCKKCQSSMSQNVPKDYLKALLRGDIATAKRIKAENPQLEGLPLIIEDSNGGTYRVCSKCGFKNKGEFLFFKEYSCSKCGNKI